MLLNVLDRDTLCCISSEGQCIAGTANGVTHSLSDAGNSRHAPLQQRGSQGSLADDRPNPLPSPASGFSRRTPQQRAFSPPSSHGGGFIHS